MREEKSPFMPRPIIYILLFLSLMPVWSYLLPFSSKILKNEVAHIVVHNFFDVSVIFIGLASIIASLLGYLVSKEFKIPMLGVVIFSTALFHLSHTVVLYFIKLEGTHSDVTEIFYWTLSSLYSGFSYLCFSICCKFFSNNHEREKSIFIFSLLTVSTVIFTVGFLVIDKNSVPNLTSGDGLFFRPWEFLSIVIYLVVAAFSFSAMKDDQSGLSKSLLCMCIPSIIMHLNLGLNFSSKDELFLNSHVLKVVSYLFPFFGIMWSLFRDYRFWNKHYSELNVIQDAINASALVSETNRYGTIEFVNEEFCKVSKYSKDELIGMSHRIINSGHHSHDLFKDMWETILDGRIWKGEICNRAKDGSIYWVSSTIYPSRNSAGEIVKFVSIRFDITERKVFEEKSQFEKLFLEYEGAQLKILNEISKDNESKNGMEYIFQNYLKEFCLNFDWDIGHLYNKDDSGSGFLLSSDIWGSNDREDYCSFKNDLQRSTYQKGEGLPGMVLKDKKAYWIEDIKEEKIYQSNNNMSEIEFSSALSFPIEFDGEVIAVVEFYSKKKKHIDQVFMNVLKKIGLELGLLNNRKKLEIQVHIEKENAERLARVKTEFLANMSHEIRTPMNGILGMVELLNDTSLDSNQENMLGTVKNCGDSLLNIVNDVLDFSKIDSGKFEIDKQQFNINECIKSVINIVSQKAKDKNLDIGFSVDSEIPSSLVGDDKRIKQILINFISNSVKFTEKGGVYINIEMISEAQHEFEVLMSVKDTGIGISENNQGKLFKAFSQADASTTRKFGGTGLGLAICSKLATLMGGKVWLESRLGQGSTFFLKLSLGKIFEKEKEDQSKILPFEVKVGPTTRVLIVEDNKVNQKIAKMMLKKIGVSCDIAENGVECLNILEKNNYDLIFMDMQMPIMDGVTATKEIVRIYGDKRPRIIAMTANVFKEDRETCFEAGMDDFIAKPVSIKELSRVFNDLAA